MSNFPIYHSEAISKAYEREYLEICGRINEKVLPVLRLLGVDNEEILDNVLMAVSSSCEMQKFVSKLLTTYLGRLSSSDPNDVCSSIAFFQKVISHSDVLTCIFPYIDLSFIERSGEVFVPVRSKIKESSMIHISGEQFEFYEKTLKAIGKVNDEIGGLLTKRKVDLIFGNVTGGYIRTPKASDALELTTKK